VERSPTCWQAAPGGNPGFRLVPCGDVRLQRGPLFRSPSVPAGGRRLPSRSRYRLPARPQQPGTLGAWHDEPGAGGRARDRRSVGPQLSAAA
jgi:hypothetical protein